MAVRRKPVKAEALTCGLKRRAREWQSMRLMLRLAINETLREISISCSNIYSQLCYMPILPRICSSIRAILLRSPNDRGSKPYTLQRQIKCERANTPFSSRPILKGHYATLLKSLERGTTFSGSPKSPQLHDVDV
jgi:hypothetical protein